MAYDGPALEYATLCGQQRGFGYTLKALAMSSSKSFIRVNAIAPGLTDTAQILEMGQEAEIIEMGNSLPLGRIIQP